MEKIIQMVSGYLHSKRILYMRMLSFIGITRGLVIQLARENNFTCIEKNLPLTELYSADEVFCTGTVGEPTPIVSIDGRKIENKSTAKILPKLIYAFEESIHKNTEQI